MTSMISSTEATDAFKLLLRIGAALSLSDGLRESCPRSMLEIVNKEGGGEFEFMEEIVVVAVEEVPDIFEEVLGRVSRVLFFIRMFISVRSFWISS